MGDFVCTNAFIIVRIYLQNHSLDILILPGSWGGFRMKMLVVCAAVNMKDSAKSLDIMLEAQLMNRI